MNAKQMGQRTCPELALLRSQEAPWSSLLKQVPCRCHAVPQLYRHSCRSGLQTRTMRGNQLAEGNVLGLV